MKWPIVTLAEVADVQLGKMLSPKAMTEVASMHPYLRNANVQWGQIDYSNLASMSFDARECVKFSLCQGDLLVCEGGEPGRCAVVPQDLSGIYFQKALMRVRPRDGRIDTRYLQRFMHFAASRGVFSQGGIQATIAHFPAVRLNALKIPLPTIDAQVAIADVLDKADAIRRKRQEGIALTEQLVRSTFLDMFHDPENAWGMATVEQLAENRPGSIRTGPFGSQLLHSEFTESGIAVLGIDNAVENEFRWGRPRYISEEKYENLRRYTVIPRDVVITIMGTCGRCAIIPDDIPTAINTKHLCCITLDKSKCLPEFLHSYFLFHPTAQSYLRKSAKGAIMDGLNMGIISQLPVPLVPLELQRRYQTFVVMNAGVKRRLTESATEADNLFHSLVHRAFTGQL